MLRAHVGLSVSVCHSVCGVPEPGQNVLGLGRRCHSEFSEWGTLLHGGQEKGGTHISQVSRPWEVLSSGGKRCSSAGQGTGGHAW